MSSHEDPARSSTPRKISTGSTTPRTATPQRSPRPSINAEEMEKRVQAEIQRRVREQLARRAKEQAAGASAKKDDSKAKAAEEALAKEKKEKEKKQTEKEEADALQARMEETAKKLESVGSDLDATAKPSEVNPAAEHAPVQAHEPPAQSETRPEEPPVVKEKPKVKIQRKTKEESTTQDTVKPERTEPEPAKVETVTPKVHPKPPKADPKTPKVVEALKPTTQNTDSIDEAAESSQTPTNEPHTPTSIVESKSHDETHGTVDASNPQHSHSVSFSPSDTESEQDDTEPILPAQSSFVNTEVDYESTIFSSTDTKLSPTYEKSLSSFEELASKKTLRSRIQVDTYPTPREDGLCLRPPKVDVPTVPNNTHLSVQLGYLGAEQTIVSLAPSMYSADKTSICDRSPKHDGKRLQESEFAFESTVAIDQNEESDVSDDDESAKKVQLHRWEEDIVDPVAGTKDDVVKIVQKVANHYSIGDPLQIWEKARGKLFPPAPSGEKRAPGFETTTGGLTAGRLWSLEHDPRKPVRAVNHFNGGALYEIRVNDITSGLVTTFGNDSDPLFFSVAVYNISATHTIKISETFYFDYQTSSFFPYKTPFETQQRNVMVTFIPAEYKSAHLFLVIRGYRLASDTSDYEADMYIRPTAYKPNDAITLKQRVQQLAMYSDVCEELGWFACSLVERNQLMQGDFMVDKLLRSQFPASDAQLAEMVLNDKKRSYCKPIPCTIRFTITDVSDHEVSFPQHMDEPTPIETEVSITLRNPNKPGDTPRTVRHVPCAVPILNCGSFNSYINIMYLRLQSLKLNSIPNKNLPPKFKSFVVQVALKDNDVQCTGDGIPAIYGRSMASSIVESNGWSTTCTTRKDLDMCDEFKIQLPLILTERHHLFFTVYAVSYQKGTFAERFTPVGYAVLPIFSNNALVVKEQADLRVLLAAHAQPSYLVKFGQLQPSAFVNNGAQVLTCSTSAKSSVHVTNPTCASWFASMPASLHEISKDGGVGETSGLMEGTMSGTDSQRNDEPHLVCVKAATSLPLAELVAFCPMTLSYLLSVICSASPSVGYTARRTAFKGLVEAVAKVNQYETSKSVGPRRETNPSKKTHVRFLYYFMSNDLLFNGQNFPVAETLAEVWLGELQAVEVGTMRIRGQRPAGYQYLVRMGELSWFFLDLILRSVLLSTTTGPKANVPRHRRFDSSFYAVLRQLITLIDEKMTPIVGLPLVIRIALFLRSLSFVCDRGEILQISRQYLRSVDTQQNSNIFSAIRVLLDADDAIMMTQPTSADESGFLLKVVADILTPNLFVVGREARVTSVALLYSLCVRAANGPKIPATAVTGLARGVFHFVENAATNWGKYKQLVDKDGNLGAFDKRQLLALTLWALYHQSESALRDWIVHVDSVTLVGLMQMLQDSQSTFRYFKGQNKCEIKSRPEYAEELDKWDARHAVLVNFLGCRVASLILAEKTTELRTVKDDKAHPLVFPFFTLLEQLVSLHNSTDTLQAAACLLHHAVVDLFPEVISKKARMSSGIVLLTFRLMSSASPVVRKIVERTYLFIAFQYHRMTGTLAKLKNLTANALVSVAETPNRDMRAAEGRISEHLAALLRYKNDPLLMHTDDWSTRYASDGDAVSHDAGSSLKVPSLFTSFTPDISISTGLKEQHKAELLVPFSQDLENLVTNMSSLFKNVLRLQVDPVMKFGEMTTAAYRDVFTTFLKQNTLKEAMKWITRLQELNMKEGNYAEAGATGVLGCALAFRVTELFFHIKGKDSKGARMNVNVLSHIFWHDYVRVVPELEHLFAPDHLYPIVADLTVIPDEKLFTLDGQIFALKTASEQFAKAQYFELAVITIRLVDTLLMSKGEYKSASLVHDALTQWCGAIASPAVVRHSFNYYYVEARLEERSSSAKLNNKPLLLQHVFKSNVALEPFTAHVRDLVSHLAGPKELVVLAGSEATKQKLRKGERRYVLTVESLRIVRDSVSYSTNDVVDRGLFVQELEHSYVRNNREEDTKLSVKQQERVTVRHRLKRAFPTTTPSIEVESSSEVTLSAKETAADTVESLTRSLRENKSQGTALFEYLYNIFKTDDFPTCGAYFTEVATTFGADSTVSAPLNALLTISKDRLDKCIAAQSRRPEAFAELMRAVVNLECILESVSGDVKAEADALR